MKEVLHESPTSRLWEDHEDQEEESQGNVAGKWCSPWPQLTLTRHPLTELLWN